MTFYTSRRESHSRRIAVARTATADRRGCTAPRRAARASSRRESKQPLIGSRYALLLRSGVGVPTGLSSVVSNAAARRIVVTTTVVVVAAAAALAPSRYFASGLLAGSICSVPPAAAAARRQTTYRSQRHASLNGKTKRAQIPRLPGRSSRRQLLAPFFRVSYPCVDRRVHSDPLQPRRTIDPRGLLVEKLSSCGRGPYRVRGDEGVKTASSTTRNVQEA